MAGITWQWRQAEAARRFAEQKATAEIDARKSEQRERQIAQRALAQVAEALGRLEIQKAEELIRDDGEGVGNLVCLDATQAGDITRTGLIWSYKGIQRSLSTASITPDGLLSISDFSGFVHCLDAETGKLFWKHDMKAHLWSSTLVADGKVFIGDEDGDFVILAASRVKHVLSTTVINGVEVDGPNFGSPIYSTCIVANGVLYITTNTHLFAIHDATRPSLAASDRPTPSP